MLETWDIAKHETSHCLRTWFYRVEFIYRTHEVHVKQCKTDLEFFPNGIQQHGLCADNYFIDVFMLDIITTSKLSGRYFLFDVLPRAFFLVGCNYHGCFFAIFSICRHFFCGRFYRTPLILTRTLALTLYLTVNHNPILIQPVGHKAGQKITCKHHFYPSLWTENSI